MSKRRQRKRYYIDAGEGVTLATTFRSPPDAETVDALKALAHAAIRHVGATTTAKRSSPKEPSSSSAAVSASREPDA